jgi:hypothetical protein
MTRTLRHDLFIFEKKDGRKYAHVLPIWRDSDPVDNVPVEKDDIKVTRYLIPPEFEGREEEVAIDDIERQWQHLNVYELNH